MEIFLHELGIFKNDLVIKRWPGCFFDDLEILKIQFNSIQFDSIQFHCTWITCADGKPVSCTGYRTKCVGKGKDEQQ